MKTMILAAALCACAGVASAADEAFPRRFAPNQFPQLVELLESKMADDGPYAASAEERAQVRALLAEIAGLIEGKARLSELDSNQRAAVDDRRTQINQLLHDNVVAEVSDAAQAKGRRNAANMLDSRPVD